VEFGEEASVSTKGRRWGAFDAWSGQHPLRPREITGGEPAILRLIAPLALLVMVAIVVCSGLGFVLARQADADLEAQHREALRGAVEALQAVSPDLSQLEPGLIRILEQASGLKGLRFGPEPEGDREVQSLIDRNGRIVGWFSWEPERPATALLMRLLPFAALIAVGLAGFACLAMWQLSRLGLLLGRSERQVHKLEYQDPLTGLPNQQRMLELLERRVAAQRSDEVLAFALIDLDGFDDLKDTVGDASGDEALVEIANRLRLAMPPDVVVGRLANARFALLMTSAEAAEVLATTEVARDAISRAVWINQVVQVSASIGFALAPRDATTGVELTRRAGLALRAAKRRGLVTGFEGALETDFDERRFIQRELARALAARAFELHYQPIVKAHGGAIVGVEALLRWHHSSRGFIPPAVFVRIAEEAGLMNQLGEFVLRRALADAARWPDLQVAVNLSPVQVRDRKLVDLVSALLAESKIAPSRLVLEVTEGVLIDDPDTAKSRLEDLRALGVRLALDDFGSGYSSLTYLQRLPFDKLKVDRGFVAALDQSANAGVIIQAIVALGRALGMSILIEGVETEEQRVLLRLAGCHEMQGFLFARPVPPEEIDQLLAAANSATTQSRPALCASA
jgi:diguanylate cyclase (GGDEF)-like protein